MACPIHHNLNAYEDFLIFCYFQVHYMFYWISFTCFWFHSGTEIPIDCLVTKGKSTYIYIYWTFKVNRTQYGVSGQATSKNARTIYFGEWGKVCMILLLFIFLICIWVGMPRVPDHMLLPWHPLTPMIGSWLINNYKEWQILLGPFSVDDTITWFIIISTQQDNWWD